MLISRNPFIFFPNSSLSSIAISRSSKLYRASALMWWMKVFTSHPTMVCLYIGVHLWVCSYVTTSAQYILFILIEWFVRWEVSARTAASLSDTATSRTCSKQHVAFLYSSLLAFSPIASLMFRWCNHTEGPTQSQLGRIPVLFYQRDQASIWLTAC